ncbi:MAG: HAD hydrolase family protein [Nitrososphaerota archaeon]|nr:HAD hydrolase family protein [Nitrososphaerota archaeon]
MKGEKRVFITDCEGPLTKNDNAFELASVLIPDGGRFFALISKYDDLQADIVKRQGYKAGDTLKLILPFLRAYGATNDFIKKYSINHLLLIPGAGDTLSYICKMMPCFIVSTSYRQYISALCEALRFPIENVFCTELDIDRYELPKEEAEILRDMCREILRMPMIEIPEGARTLNDLNPESLMAVRRLDEIFWDKIYNMRAGRMLIEVNPIGGVEKAKAVNEIVSKVGTDLSNVMYVGDSITDVEPLKLVREEGGLAVSFNGNHYAVREADIAIMSHHTIILSIIAEIFNKFGKEVVIRISEDWSLDIIASFCNPSLLNNLKNLHPSMQPVVRRITKENMKSLMQESNVFRRSVRGEAVGKLG